MFTHVPVFQHYKRIHGKVLPPKDQNRADRLNIFTGTRRLPLNYLAVFITIVCELRESVAMSHSGA